ncbi:G-protein coupled receptor GRL101-like [Littorina saxatilis]|uniref:G-protein coupled receptor GRL101-like n=1 Tax=Littorina saxatilis TaxID=31220 RepID=UPI0038B5D342
MVRKSGFHTANVGISKVKPVVSKLRHFYRFLWQWGDKGSPIAYDQHTLQTTGAMADCVALNVLTDGLVGPMPCSSFKVYPDGFFCMKPNPTRETQRFSLSGLSFPRPSKTPDEFPTKECPDGSVVQTFHSCQWGAESEDEAGPGLSLRNLPLFQCRFGPAVHYTDVCDGHDDCMDGSDETKCHRPQFAPIIVSTFICKNFQVVRAEQKCDGQLDCFDESDEDSCASCGDQIMCLKVGCVPKDFAKYVSNCLYSSPVAVPYVRPPFPAAVNMNGYGLAELDDVNGSCADTFYHCQGGHCIPTFLLNNGEQDCPQGEDEGLPVTNITCPGYYRCRGDGRCVHWDYLCDGIYHCANKDDEFFCHMTCPRGCQCEGHAYTCSKMVDPLENLYVRYLDLSNASVVSLDGIHYMEYLFFLNLTSCGLPNITLVNMPQLLILDLSFNNLTDLASMNLSHLPGLEQLSLSNNLLVQTIGGSFTNTLHSGKLENLKILRMTNVGLKTMEDTALRPLASLSYLDISQNPLRTYGAGALSGLTALEELHTDEFKLCCRHFHSTLRRCLAPVDELSSCSDLLAQDFFRVCLWGLSGLSIVGNIGVLVYRQLMSTKNSPSAAGVLIKNLCASDLLMGVYMMIIGTADAQLRGDYVTKDTDWKTSPVCTVAGFLCFLSSEVSALVVCLITLDRVLVIGFPFHSQLHLSHGVSVALCCVVWATGAALAAVPLLADLQFYGQNGICILLPITRQDFLGQHYAFGVFFVLNFIFFIVIGLGQLFIFTVIRRSSVAAGTQKQQRDLAIARRLFTVALTDFCCWFPIGLMGLLAARGVPIPGIVNVWAAIFVLPLNSALNPFLYTLNGLLHQWRKKRMEKTTRKMRGNVTTEVLAWQPDSVHNLVKMCVQSRKIDKEVLMKLLGGTAVSTTATAGREESSHSSDDRRGQ